ncbi:DMT family transporter [Mycobacterium sp.]|uniref:DMT family transporter n=1 Tax=Mycobacterium sp. TaxID=1785 RepID=UPI003A86D08B
MGWLTSNAPAIVCALLAALFVAVGIVVRQIALQRPGITTERPGQMVSAVLHDHLWWAGTGAAIAGFAFQATALAHGSLLLVQPLLVSSLLFVLPLSAWRAGHRVTGAEWFWAVLLTSGLAVFVLAGHPHQGHNRPSTLVCTLGLGAAALIAIAGVLVALLTAGGVRATSLGVSVAVALGMIAVLTKICTRQFTDGGWHALLTSPMVYLLVALAVIATVLQQWAFHAGALQASVPSMLVGEPVVAVALGLTVMGEQLTVRGVGTVVLPLAIVAMLAATIALGRGEGADTERAALSPAS